MTDTNRIVELASTLKSVVDDTVAEKEREIAELKEKLEAAEKHIGRCERTLAAVAKISHTEAQENWSNVKERLWGLTYEFADEPRFDVGPLKPFSKDRTVCGTAARMPREG